MSRKPGIGFTWLEKFLTDIYPNGKVVTRGHLGRAPRYYDLKYKEKNPTAHADLKIKREYEAYQRRGDNTDERLLVKETVAKAATKTLKRTIE